MLASTSIAKVAWSLAAGAALALGGWVYSIHGRVSAVEADRASTAQRLQDLRDDVRDLRNALLGPREPAREGDR